MYLSVNSTDLSGFITQESFSCITEPVYDASAEYINANGERVRTWCGSRTVVKTRLSGVTEAAVRALRACAALESVSVVMFAPDRESLSMGIERLEIKLAGVDGDDEKVYSAELEMCSPDCGCL